jgi:peptide/nickel transport system substrate-binding protein
VISLSRIRMLMGAAIAAVAVAIVASGSSTGASAAASRTLETAITADLSPLDPDTYYEAEGLPITTSAYDGLLTYAPNSPKLVGRLATSWTESADGLTYTFTLRHGVRFSDGTPFNSTAAQASFERRSALKAGPSYMLADVKSYATPGPYTFVVHLRTPVAPFLDYLASPYGPLMSSPTAVKKHAAGKDLASKWFGGHSDGTGPYVLSAIKSGVSYTLTANPDYWGPKPYFTTIVFNVVPTPEQQRLELQGGQLDMIFGEQSTRDLEALAQDSSVQVTSFPALFKEDVWINPASKVFGKPAMRAALRAGLDNVSLTKAVFGPYGTPSTEVYPNGMLPAGVAPDKPAYNLSTLKNALAQYKGQHLVLGYYEEGNAQQVLADFIQVELQPLGLNVTLRGYPASALFNLPTSPSQRPDLMVAEFNPDAAAPDTWSRIYWYKNAPVNLLDCTSPQADKLLDQARAQPNEKAAQSLSARAAEAYRASNCWLNISDVQDTVITRKGITGFVHELPWVLDVDLADLRNG